MSITFSIVTRASCDSNDYDDGVFVGWQESFDEHISREFVFILVCTISLFHSILFYLSTVALSFYENCFSGLGARIKNKKTS